MRRTAVVWLFLLGLIGGLLTIAPTARAAVCTVPGTHLTIQNAANDPTCTTIKLQTGVFFESVQILQPNTKVIGSGGKCNRRGSTIDAGQFGTGLQILAPGVSVSNVTVRHGVAGIVVDDADFTGSRLCVFGQRGGSDPDALSISGTGAQVRSSEFHSADGSGVELSNTASNAIIEGNLSHNNGDNCFHSFAAGTQFLSNRAFDCDDQGFRTEGSDADNIVVDGNRIRSVNNGIEHTEGDAVTITRNRIVNVQDKGIRASDGPNYVVANNRIDTARHRCVEAGNANNAQVLSNRGRQCGGMEVNGENPVVTSNRMDMAWENHGYRINCPTSCANARITGNFVGATLRDHNGFEISSDASGGAIENNTSRYSGNNGFLLRVDGWTIRNNLSEWSGKREDGNDRNGFRLDDADNNILTGNVARWGRDDGFFFASGSDGNTLTSNQAFANVKDGFHVASGDSNILDLNRATANHGEGIQNEGTLTTLTDNVAKGNRTDCVGDTAGEATDTGNTCADGSDFVAAPANGTVD